MKKVTKILMTIIMAIVTLVPFTKAHAAEPINIYIFYGSTCPYCEAAIKHFESIEEESGYMFKLVKYEVWNNQENADLMKQVAAKYGDEVSGVPYIIIGEKTFSGYAEQYDADILEAIKKEYESTERYDVMNELKVAPKEEKKDSTTVYIVLGTVVVGLVALLAFSKAKAN